jgi:hypothetical protein
VIALLIVAPISGRVVMSETLRRIYWTNVSVHTKVLVGHCGRQGNNPDEESRVLLSLIKNGSTLTSATVIPSWPALFPQVRAWADFLDANAAEATSHP